MATKTQTVDWGGITLKVKDLIINASKPGAAGSALSTTELGYIDGLTPGTTTASKALVVGSSKNVDTLTSAKWLTSTNVGTVTTGATTVAEEHGDGIWHYTKLTMTAFAVGTGADNASLGIGAKFYTFPAGTIIVKHATLVGATTFDANVTTGSPEIGIGTAVASGVVSVLSGTATFEDIIDGNASATGGDTTGNLTATTIYKNSDGSTRDAVVIKTSGGKSHDLFLNMAVAWPDSASGTLAVTFTGVITLQWMLVT